MGLAACPRASFAWVVSGWEWKALLRTRSANVPGTVWVDIGPHRHRPASALSALRSGIAKGAINAAWDAIGEVIKAWATEGHSVAVPGLGTMRFGLRSKSIADVNKVGSDLITTRRVIFTPNVEIKDELARTSINITCYDRNGNVVKRVTSSDDGTVEDPEETNENENQNENGSQGGSQNGSSQSGSGSENTGGSGTGTTGSGSTETGGSGTDTNGSNDSNGGSSTGGSSTGSETGGGDNTGGGDEDEPGGDDH